MEEEPSIPSAPVIKKKHEEKYRKKDHKSWDNVSKTLATLEEPAKLAHVQEKYVHLYNEYRTATVSNQALIKQMSSLQKEDDHVQNELAKSVVVRARLEDLCRELQKQNKQIKEENFAKIKEEEERRKEVSVKFAQKLSDINAMMDDNKEKSYTLREENQKMTTKLAELYSQFQRREDHITKMSHQLELERQYSQATLSKMELEFRAEKEINAREQFLLKSNLEKSESNCKVLLETVKGLQEHINVYKSQYADFETTMSKSNKVFDNFKFEVSAMTKKINVMERESQSWKNKFHDSMKAIVELTENKRNQEMLLVASDRKNEQLQKLCRQLQVDRANFLKLLKTNGIETPSSSVSSKDEEACKQSNPKMTKKEKELQLIKDNLQVMQDELTKLAMTDVEPKNPIEVLVVSNSDSPVQLKAPPASPEQNPSPRTMEYNNITISMVEEVAAKMQAAQTAQFAQAAEAAQKDDEETQ